MIRFARDERGGLIPIFAIMLPVLILAIGAALGVGNKWYTKARLQTMADQASLAAAQAPEADRAQVAADYIAANNDTGLVVTPTVTPEAGADAPVTVELSAEVPATLTAPAETFETHAKAKRAPNAEIALVIDTSAGIDVAAVKAELLDLADRVKGQKIAVVPFAGAVNVGKSYAGAPWLATASDFTDGNATQGDWQTMGGDSTDRERPNVELFANLSGVEWGGCVEARVPPHDANNNAPVNPNRRFVPYFSPDLPDTATCSTSTCKHATSGGTAYNGAPSGAQDFNNYLPDNGVAPSSATSAADMASKTSCPASYRFYTGQTPFFRIPESQGATDPEPFVIYNGNVNVGGASGDHKFFYVRDVSSLTGGAMQHKAANVKTGTPILDVSASTDGVYALAPWACIGCPADFGSELKAVGGNSTVESGKCKYGKQSKPVTVASITVAGMAGGPNWNCPAWSSRILLEADPTAAINALPNVGAGSADIADGIAWGWHVLTDSFAFGATAPAPDKQKIIVLVSPGVNSYPASPSGSTLHSGYAARGFTDSNRFGWGATCDATCAAGQLDTKTRAVCDAAKAAGIRIRAVNIGGDPNGVLAYCASPNDYVVGFDEIESIGVELADVALVE